MMSALDSEARSGREAASPAAARSADRIAALAPFEGAKHGFSEGAKHGFSEGVPSGVDTVTTLPRKGPRWGGQHESLYKPWLRAATLSRSDIPSGRRLARLEHGDLAARWRERGGVWFGIEPGRWVGWISAAVGIGAGGRVRLAAWERGAGGLGHPFNEYVFACGLAASFGESAVPGGVRTAGGAARGRGSVRRAVRGERAGRQPGVPAGSACVGRAGGGCQRGDRRGDRRPP